MDIKYFHEISDESVCFYAKHDETEVSHLIVEHSENCFPYTLSMNTSEEFRGRGIMMNLITKANEFYSTLTEHKLRSSKYPTEEVFEYYKSLEEKGLVEKDSEGRWIFN